MAALIPEKVGFWWKLIFLLYKKRSSCIRDQCCLIQANGSQTELTSSRWQGSLFLTSFPSTRRRHRLNPGRPFLGNLFRKDFVSRVRGGSVEVKNVASDFFQRLTFVSRRTAAIFFFFFFLLFFGSFIKHFPFENFHAFWYKIREMANTAYYRKKHLWGTSRSSCVDSSVFKSPKRSLSIAWLNPCLTSSIGIFLSKPFIFVGLQQTPNGNKVTISHKIVWHLKTLNTSRLTWTSIHGGFPLIKLV